MVTRRTVTGLLTGAAWTLGSTPAAGARRRRASGTAPVDVAVIGAGAFGAWTAHALRARGQRVLLVDAYGPANDRASSGGESRIIRSAYGAAAVYARMAHEALPVWQSLAARRRLRLFESTGVLTVHRADAAFAEDSARVLEELQIPHQRLSAADTRRRFPAFWLEDGEAGLFEPGAGALLARRAIQALVEELVESGVEYRLAAARPPAGRGALDSVDCLDAAPIRARRFVFACGPWLAKLFPALLGPRIRSQRGEVFFLGLPAGDSVYLPPAMPTWIDLTVDGGAYGMPGLEARGAKVAVDVIDREIDPDTGDRTVSAPYIEAMRAFVARRFPGLAAAPVVETRVCQYEMTPDEDYVLDRHPDFDNVWIAGGGSGHGFKTSPIVGREVARLVLDGERADARFAIAKVGG